MKRSMILAAALLLAAGSLRAQTSPHGTLSIPCASCHTTDSWHMRADAQFLHASTGFDLQGVHKTVDCAGCHTGLRFAGTKSDCRSCHTDVHKSELGSNCLRCHTFQSWRITDMIQRHQQTRFPLVGNHAAAECSACHTKSAGSQYVGTPTTCIGCHRPQYEGAVNPNHRTAGFSTDCSTCHKVTAPSWGTGFNHAATRFPLTGAHAAVACINCHKTPTFSATATACVTCHAADVQQTTNPNHAAAGFTGGCETCHTPTAWSSGAYDHAVTAFPLSGRHAAAECRSCHGDNIFKGKPTDCYACHQSVYDATTAPAHKSGGFPHACLSCHTAAGWKPSSFTHDNTAFPLQGAHRSAACTECHSTGQYAGTNKTCVGCHQSNYNGAVNPNHVAGGFSTQCSTCHSTTNWRSTSFDHSTTHFALTGAHAAVPCATCHAGGNYQVTYQNCGQCHLNDYQRTTNPNHTAQGFSQECQTCHTTTAWSPASFNHAQTRFALTGAHQSAQCASCHKQGNYQLTYTDCYACHQERYAATTSPSHTAGAFSHSCETCHSTTAWTPSTFSHTQTRFALTGAHVTAQCASCHAQGNYQLTYTDCYACHQNRYAATTDPNHTTGNFAHTCESCHGTSAWKPSTFSHAQTAFPLQGAHQAVTCVQCHATTFAGTPTTCYTCHAADYASAVNPNHATGGFSQTCTACHSMNGWKPATFDHNTTRLALTGKHALAACQDCHTNGNYQLTYQNCAQCHLSDFQKTTNPSHATAAFSQVCDQCHTANGWSPATFSTHGATKFALTGAHTAVACATCHVSGNYKVVYTDCYQCHQSKFAVPTMPNHVVANFAHQCETCHSTSVWKPWTINHDTKWFKIYSGKHNGRWGTDCTKCHTATNYPAFTCMSSGCHSKSSTDNNHTQVANYVYAAANCYSCHKSI